MKKEEEVDKLGGEVKGASERKWTMSLYRIKQPLFVLVGPNNELNLINVV